MKQISTFFIVLLLSSTTAVGQQGQIDELSVDELYEKARMEAFEEGDYNKAREYAYRALDKSPDYHGIRIFIARLYSWEGDYGKAREALQYVLKRDPENRRAYLAIVDVESWAGKLDEALRLVNQATEYHPKDEELLLKKASVLYNMEDYEMSEKVYEKVLKQSPSSKKARDGLKSAQLKQMKYSATLSYRYDYFEDIFDPWKFTEIGLTRQTPYGSIIGRVQYAERFGGTGTQFNLDTYPSITDGLYAYISGGFSESSIYPRYRFGLSLYKSLPASFELEAGFRYLDFVSSQTDIYTASLTKYVGSYLFTLRTYLVPSSQGSSNSLSGVLRRYFGDAYTYLSLTGGFGSASTEIEFSQDIQTLDSWSVGIDGQYPLSDKFFIGGNAGFDSSEYQNFVRERFSFKAFVTYRF